MTSTFSHRRAGFTLVEVLITLVMIGVVAGALTRLQMAQGRFVSHQDAARDARAASRSALNMMLSNFRMVEVSGGILGAASDAVTARVPYAFGVVCGSGGGVTIATLLPADSATLAAVEFSGWAWRNGDGDYTYQTIAPTIAGDAGTMCTLNGIATVDGGRAVALEPMVVAPPGTPIFLFEVQRWHFSDSAVLPGRRGLWLTAGTKPPEELAAPFDTTAGFRFFVHDEDSARATPPAVLGDLRGLELLLHGASVLPPQGRTEPSTYLLSAAVFFQNRRY